MLHHPPQHPAATNPHASQSIWCCACQRAVTARLTVGREIYPRRADLAALPFWRCDSCRNHVGCHHKSSQPTRPLGNIPTPALRAERQKIHVALDTLWQSKRYPRGKLYAELTTALGRQYHTAELRSIEEAELIHRAIQDIAARL